MRFDSLYEIIKQYPETEPCLADIQYVLHKTMLVGSGKQTLSPWNERSENNLLQVKE